MVSKPTKSQLQHEAIAILEAKAQRSINDIRQRAEFICSFLRAQGNSQINQLNLPIRQLTMREFCHEYGADTMTVFQQQAKARLQRVKKRTRDDVEKEDNEASSTPTSTTTTMMGRMSSVEIESPISRPPMKRVKRVLPQRAVKGKNPLIPKRVRVEQQPIILSSSEGSHDEQEEENDTLLSTAKTTIVENTSNNNTIPSSTTTTPSNPMKKPQDHGDKNNSHRKMDNIQQEADDEEFGPLFVHLEKPNHPRVGFQLDPQRTTDELGQFKVHMPNEVFGRMNQIQRDRLYHQIQDIQNQLEKVKLQLSPN
ncbi:hypothetical protein BDA99DRAFT_528291 [Phascolomyces articulosus]|uniref:Borealin N-terminal domain-containing protein n=1 Tax=Phascolomyces articulosus TaxID=60185 RepID=A0AAD5P7W1_9FUNG|nr:hypothetical protein BDA99DRAFT_528291 [Phascolomyces articulosus]